METCLSLGTAVRGRSLMEITEEGDEVVSPFEDREPDNITSLLLVLMLQKLLVSGLWTWGLLII